MKKLLQSISSLLAVLMLLTVVFGCGYYAGSVTRGHLTAAEAPDSPKPDLKLPGERQRRVITQEEVCAQIEKLGELATYCGEYSVKQTSRSNRTFLEGLDIPGTTNVISVRCSGVVKVGYDVDAIAAQVDNDSRIIYIALPEPRVLDNYIIWDTVECYENNNILHPIEFSQYQTMLTELEAKGLEQVERKGIYPAAQDHMQVLLGNFLAGFDEYEVVFL